MNDSRDERAVRVIASHLTGGHAQRMGKARKIVEEINKAPIQYPVEDSIDAFRAAYCAATTAVDPLSDDDLADCLSEALKPDPIHQLALKIAQSWRDTGQLGVAVQPGEIKVISGLDELMGFCIDAELLS